MKFFDLKDYYQVNFNLVNNYKWSLNDIENMMFWEREIYINLLAEHNEKIMEKIRISGKS
jgi:hypothetical protein